MQTLQDFALTQYRDAEVAKYCLRLQDELGADVNMLLTAGWLAAQGRRWQPEQVRDLIARCAQWREHCVLPLRTVRRYIKDRPEASGLYERMKAVELDAEMLQLQWLHDGVLTLAPAKDSAGTSDILAANLHTYCRCIDPNRNEDIHPDCHALTLALGRRLGDMDIG